MHPCRQSSHQRLVKAGEEAWGRSEDSAASLELQNQVARLEFLHGFGEACLPLATRLVSWKIGQETSSHEDSEAATFQSGQVMARSKQD